MYLIIITIILKIIIDFIIIFPIDTHDCFFIWDTNCYF